MKFSSDFIRSKQIEKMIGTPVWDIIVVGGGASGLGVALDAASRGYKTLLLEQVDFAKGTSSRSTKLVHGGVRYLAQGNIKLVYEALKERGLLLKNAPHLVKIQDFIIPCYSWWSKYKYLIGLKLYDWLSGNLSFGKSQFLKRKTIINLLPRLHSKKLVGGIQYFDGQFDDARLAINLAQSCVEAGGVVLNHFKVTDLIKTHERLSGVSARDSETGEEYKLEARVVINATGVFVDDIMQLDIKGKKPTVSPSQGVHIVLNKAFLSSESALMIPETSDGRVLFAIPWHKHLLVGTTDTLVDKPSLDPQPLQKEISFILDTVNRYLSIHPEEKDILSVFAGLRPLAAPDNHQSATKEISRDHKLVISSSGLLTITGGKWTTYRKIAEETVNKAIQSGKLVPAACSTENRKIHGWTNKKDDSHLGTYGADADRVTGLMNEESRLRKRLVPKFSYTEAEVVWAIRYEMARTIEDVLSRRLRILFLDARAAIDAAPRVAELLCHELNYNETWMQVQLSEFYKLANQYLLEPYSTEKPIYQNQL